MFGIVVAALALIVIAAWFWKAIAPLRRNRDDPPSCHGCCGCDGMTSMPDSCPSSGKTLYEIDRFSTSTDPEEP